MTTSTGKEQHLQVQNEVGKLFGAAGLGQHTDFVDQLLTRDLSGNRNLECMKHKDRCTSPDQVGRCVSLTLSRMPCKLFVAIIACGCTNILYIHMIMHTHTRMHAYGYAHRHTPGS
jgi:hypothetical protein